VDYLSNDNQPPGRHQLPRLLAIETNSGSDGGTLIIPTDPPLFVITGFHPLINESADSPTQYVIDRQRHARGFGQIMLNWRARL